LIEHRRSHFSLPPPQMKERLILTSLSINFLRLKLAFSISPVSIFLFTSKAAPNAPINPGSGGTIIFFPMIADMASGTAAL